MDIGDWVAAGIAFVGVGVSAVFSVLAFRRSGKALRASVDAPHLARNRALRDALRQSMNAARDEAAQLSDALSRNREIDEPSEVLTQEADFLEATAPRLPEQWELLQIELQIRRIYSAWSHYVWVQGQVKWHGDRVIKSQTGVSSGSVESRQRASESLLKHQDERERAVRDRDKATQDAKAAVADFKKRVKAYLDRLDDHDRIGTDPS